MELNLEPVPENPVKKKQTAVGVSAAAIVMLVVTLVGGHWLAPADPLSGGMGLRGYEICYQSECQSQSNKALITSINENRPESDKKSPVFWICGYATIALVVLACLFLGIAAALVWKGKFYLGQSFAPTGLAFLLLFAALITGMVFVATNPTKGTAIQLGVGWTFWLFGVGVVTGIVGAQLLNKFKPAPDLTI